MLIILAITQSDRISKS